MAHLFTPTLERPPALITIDVDFYDSVERDALLRGPSAAVLKDLPGRITVPTPDFCAYYLRYKLRPGVEGFSTHADMKRKWGQALVEFDGQCDFSESSVRLIQVAGQSTGTTERLGEALGLSVASALHGLHDGDWLRVPKQQVKTLDFQHSLTASDGQGFVELEAKGSCTENNAIKSNAVQQHKSNIKAKKAAIVGQRRGADVMYGTIGVLDTRANSVAKCWLVDPPVVSDHQPDQFKVIARLTFIADLLSFLSPRSMLSAVLNNRLAAMRVLPDISPLDDLELRTRRDEESTYGTIGLAAVRHPWFAGKSVVSDGRAGGQVYPLDRHRILFIGVMEELLELATRQSFASIRKYRLGAEVLSKTVLCAVSTSRFRREFELALKSLPVQRSRDGQVRFRLAGALCYCTSGLVFGILDVPTSEGRPAERDAEAVGAPASTERSNSSDAGVGAPR